MGRLKTLTLKNFRCYEHAEFIFDQPITFIIGAEGTGKSSVGDAIEWVLSGRCRGTDNRGAGSKSLIRDGEKGTVVILGLDGDGDMPASRTLTLAGGGSADAVPLMNADIVKVLCDGKAFLDLGHQDAKDLLLRVLNVRVTVKGIPHTLAALDAAYQEAFDDRKAAKRVLDTIQVPPLPENEMPDVEALEQKLTGLREEEKRLVAEQAVTAVKASGRREDLDRRLRQARDNVGKIEQGIRDREYPADLEAQIDRLDAELEKTARPDDDAAAPEALATIAGELKPLAEALRNLKDHDPNRGCLLNVEIPCKTPGSLFKAHVGALKMKIQALLAKQASAEARSKRDRQAEEVRKAAQARRQNLQVLLNQRASDNRTLADARKVVEDLARELEALPIEPATVTAQGDQALGQVKARIANGEVVIREARAIARQIEVHHEHSARRADAARKVAELEAIVDELGPKGVRVKALGAAITGFTERINQALTRFGYSLGFQFDPWMVSVNGRPAAVLSSSERLRVGVALQLALAGVTELGFVIIDGAELLLRRNRAILTDLLCIEGSAQAIVLATREDDYEPPAAQGITFYRLRRKALPAGDFGPTTVERCGAAVDA
jgi:DNA repair exonuclease SbcCD ATPase subunit